ncbi:MAG: hypothetical protein Q8L13_19230 [Bradyrhizobium sp.]|uniref:hypothetical protein n=1 Tax=Bradyrhizobium sp. TaxID=376 RepID=UPI002730715A|nr:hypothetical protein [Bradyrhizobium sp.]MDP1868456.1 hypothetical protein [Bradyrhizobium sp.]
MTIERPMFPPRREIETVEPFAIQDAFCTALVRIERIGTCRRLVFSVPDDSAPESPQRLVTAKLILPAEALASIAAQLFQDAPAEAARDAATVARHRALAN